MLSCGMVSVILHLAVLTQYWHETDRRTYDNGIYHASITSRGKNLNLTDMGDNKSLST